MSCFIFSLKVSEKYFRKKLFIFAKKVFYFAGYNGAAELSFPQLFKKPIDISVH